MKLRILSDIHVEFFQCSVPSLEVDAVLLAGDIGKGMLGLEWAAREFDCRKTPVIYVPGNHEYYDQDMTLWGEQAQALCASTGIVLGNPSTTLLEKPGQVPVRVLATTLWTDFALFGEDKVASHGAMTQSALNDYRVIEYRSRILRWEDTLALHQQMLAWLTQECIRAREAGEKVVVVTHHAPSLKSSLPIYKKDPVTAGFGSNLEDFASTYVDVWVHGHMHNSSSYTLGKCRVIANPRGYPRQRWNPDTDLENPQFNPVLVVEV